MSALHSAVTTVTHNIPWILSEPAIALIGLKCYNSLVYDFNITDVECLKYALSKGLGFGIVLGGSIVKVPQIMKIVRSGSARGLSLSAYILETASYAISLAYASRSRFPFSTYGENFFITIQNIIITLMILHYNKPKGSTYAGLGRSLSSSHTATRRRVVFGAAIIAASCLYLWNETLCPMSIRNLSAFAVFSALLGCLARLFTTKQEVNDPLIFWGFAGAALLNFVLVLQMLMFWRTTDEQFGSKHKLSGVAIADPGFGLAERKLD
ncbi:hypothetical protein CcaverHIS641_0209720 [Cutaneotrichosporon cavernicola]|nr:hypothetical protein CcaverHIS641_0209720 [Cutaneotrichosporon cavernicola]